MKTGITLISVLPQAPLIRLFALLSLLAFFAIGCSSISGGVEDTISKKGVILFEFKSGGAYHPSGYGEWMVTLNAPDKFSMIKKIGDKKTDRGTVTLTDDEKTKLWGLIDTVDIVNLKPPHRNASPDEVILTFRVNDNVGTHIREVLIGDAREREAVVSLIEYIGTLIEKYTGEKPVLM